MLLVAITATSLGFWQLDRAAQKKALQAQLDLAASREPTRVGAVPLSTADIDGMPVAATGQWRPERTVFLDNRTHEGVAGFHVLTPLQVGALPDGTPMYVVVLRGFVARDIRDRAALPTLTEQSAPLTVTGQALAELPQTMLLGSDPDPGPRDRLWQRFTLERYRHWSGLAIQPFVIRQRNDSGDGLLRDWVQPGLKVEMHYGYALQWFGMALAVVVFWAWARFFRKGRRDTAPSDSDGVGA